ncbi:unnamed protein product [Cunninghamella echinulata]
MAPQLTEQQLDQSERIGFRAGYKGALIGASIGLVATAITFKKSPIFRSLGKPIQATMIVAGASSGFLFAADRAVSKYHNMELGYMDEEMYATLQDPRKIAKHQNMSSFDKSLQFLNNNRWSFIGATWALSMVAALGYSFSNKYLSTQQKIVQARMYAQAATIGVLMASASLSIYLGDDNKKHHDNIDPQLLAVLQLPHDEKNKVEENKLIHT